MPGRKAALSSVGPYARPPLERMMIIHAKLQAGEYPNCRTLSEALEVSGKTIQRDIDFMRDRLGHPIQYDPLHSGYIYTEPLVQFPPAEMTSGELVALLVAQKAMQQFAGTAYGKQLATAFRKLTDQMKEKITFSWSEVNAAVSFHKIGVAETDLQTFEELSRAVLQCQVVSFEYRKLAGKAFEERRLQPYHLGSIENQWYVIGYDLDRQQIRSFALTRLQHLKVTATRFERPANFSIEAHLDQSFGAFAGGPNRYQVVIHFDAVAGALVAERQWHPNQKVKPLSGDRVELTMELCSLREIERWILSWGGRAQAIAPPELLERLRQSSGALAKLYA